MRAGAIFGPIHEISRHAIHTSEILQAAIETFIEMQHCRAAMYKSLGDELGHTYKAQAVDYAKFQISMLKSLKLRSESNQERLKNEINLVRLKTPLSAHERSLTPFRPSTTWPARTTAS
jgi:hypothetical protein